MESLPGVVIRCGDVLSDSRIVNLGSRKVPSYSLLPESNFAQIAVTELYQSTECFLDKVEWKSEVILHFAWFLLIQVARISQLGFCIFAKWLRIRLFYE